MSKIVDKRNSKLLRCKTISLESSPVLHNVRRESLCKDGRFVAVTC